jgi:hypothetical protein
VVYLTKQLRMQDLLEGWPPYTHLVSRTGGWLPREGDANEDETARCLPPERRRTSSEAQRNTSVDDEVA